MNRQNEKKIKYRVKHKGKTVLSQEIITANSHRTINQFECTKTGYKVLQYLKTQNHSIKNNKYYIPVEKLLEILKLPNKTREENQELINSKIDELFTRFRTIKFKKKFIFFREAGFSITNLIDNISLDRVIDVVKISFFINPFIHASFQSINEERKHIFGMSAVADDSDNPNEPEETGLTIGLNELVLGNRK